MNDLADHFDTDERTGIRIHDAAGFAGMRAAGRLAAEALDMLVPYVVPEAVTAELDEMVREFVLGRGAVPATIFYRGYSHSSCISINHVVCHGIPGAKRLKDGDIVNIDITVIVDGWHGDTSRMFLVGDVGVKAKRLVDITWESLQRGIAAAKPGNTVGDIGWAIQSFAGSAALLGGERFLAATGWARCFTMRPTSSIMAAPDAARSWCRACSSPSSL